MKRLSVPIAGLAAAIVVGCGSTATPPVATQMMDAPGAVATEAQITMATATLSVTGMH